VLYKDFIERLEENGVEVAAPIGSGFLGAQMVMQFSALSGAIKSARVWVGDHQIAFDPWIDGPGAPELMSAYHACIKLAEPIIRKGA